MRISKKLREEAALVCAMCASNGPISVSRMCELVYGEHLNDVARVAVRAWDAACRTHTLIGRGVYDNDALRNDYAEAEALLRTGWTP